MKAKNLIITFIVAIMSSFIAILGNEYFNKNDKIIQQESMQAVSFPRYVNQNNNQDNFDFIQAAENTIHGVVHIKTIITNNQTDNPISEFFYHDRRGFPSMGSGSGVIISSDGYIVTNNHVIEQSNEIEVVLNDKRSFKAKIIGTDPLTDLALIKIDAKDLLKVTFGNSDDVKIGEWVLAVGNPFNLTSTVTAGIVSAKARNINIMRNRPYSIESFIQTDAAVNPGNSGGALVNTKGQLVGINSAIASQTGSYSGYSFAIPVNIVKKIVADLKEFGVVQRALLGVSIKDVDSQIAETLDLDKIEGVYIESAIQGGAAEKSGLTKDDVIIKVSDVKVNKVSELQEQISKYRPGDIVKITYKRNNKTKEIKVTLRNQSGNTDKVSTLNISILGASFSPLTNNEKRNLNIRNGIKIDKLSPGKLMKSGAKEGYIITDINRTPVNSVEDINKIIKNANGGIYIRGLYPNGKIEYYAFGID